MKTATYFVFIIIPIVICACHKNAVEATYPDNVDFELIDKNGQSLVHSLKDSVKFSYMQNGVLKYHNLNIYKLQVAYNDTMTVKYYNGLVINDGRSISGFSGLGANSPGAIHDFTIYLNGVSMCNLYFDYWNFLSVPHPSKYATFNNIPCTLDLSFKYFSPGIGILVLQTQ